MKVLVRDRQIRYNRWPAWRPMPVTEHSVLRSDLGEELYYLCPKCRILLPREYMRFCDVCGQRLDWNQINSEDED